MKIELNESTDTDVIRMILSVSNAARMDVGDFVTHTLRNALVSQGADRIVQLEDEVCAWEIIRNFGKCPSHITGANEMELYELLKWVKSQWLKDDDQFQHFTTYDMGRLLGTRWCHESRSGESLSGEQTLAECWDMMGFDADEFRRGTTENLVHHLNEALSPTGSIACVGELLSFIQWGLK
jgi:hypothetical protein